MDEERRGAETEPARCAQCGTSLLEGQDRVTTDDGIFCRPCYNNLTEQLRQAVLAQGRDINYFSALLGALLGGAVGVIAWWGFTVVTQIAFGLVAVVIGVAVAKGAMILTGHKRSQGIQVLSVTVSTICFFYASYLVNRTFIQRALGEEGTSVVLPLLPAPDLFFEVVKAGFNVMDLVFLAIVVYEAWKIPAPMRLPG